MSQLEYFGESHYCTRNIITSLFALTKDFPFSVHFQPMYHILPLILVTVIKIHKPNRFEYYDSFTTFNMSQNVCIVE